MKKFAVMPLDGEYDQLIKTEIADILGVIVDQLLQVVFKKTRRKNTWLI